MRDLDHPPQALLRKLFRGELDAAAARPLVRHLLGACRVCSRRLRGESAALRGGAALARLPAAREQDYDLAIDRAWRRVALHGPAAAGTRRLAQRVEALLAAGAAAVPGAGEPSGAGRGAEAALRGVKLARSRGHRRGIAFYEALLARAWAVRFDDRAAAITLTELACRAASGLAADGFSAAQVADFEARAWGEHANALRAAMQLPAAERALARAMDLAARGTMDLWVNVRLSDIGASLLAYQRQRRDAVSILGQVHEMYLKLGDLNSAGKALVGRATYLGHEGDPELGERLLAKALELLDPESEPAVTSIALHSRIWFLAAAGRYREARSLLWKNREWMATFSSLGMAYQAKLAHLEGYINAGLGEHERAERALQAALGLLSGREVAAMRGIIALDLVVVLLHQGRSAEACRLAADTALCLLAVDMPAEGVKALRFLQRALDHEWATAVLVQGVVDFLRQVEHMPEARFDATR